MPFDPSLYFIADPSLIKGDPLKVVSSALKGGVTMLQLRLKSASDDQWMALAPAIVSLAREHGVPILINDRVDLAIRLKADGVHLGQGDMPIQEARTQLGNSSIIGISTHTMEEAISAGKAGADYIGVGTVFPTSSKSDIRGLLGIDGLARIRAAVSIPIVAIGGIDHNNVKEVMKTGVQGIAVISAIGQDGDPRNSVVKLLDLIRNS